MKLLPLAVTALVLAADGASGQTNPCAPLPAPTGTIIDVTPAQAGQLPSIVFDAPAASTVRLADGVYALGGASLVLRSPGVILRSGSGNAAGVVLDNGYQGGDLIAVSAQTGTASST